jgi:hypothetical protein
VGARRDDGFNAKWSGDEYFILFNEHGAAMKGFDHESVMSPWSSDDRKIWPGVYDKVPAEFSSFLNEPAFSMDDATFCMWTQHGDSSWHIGVEEFPSGEDPDGSAWMLEMLGADPRQYKRFAEDYYSADLPLEAIEDAIMRDEVAVAESRAAELESSSDLRMGLCQGRTE